MSLSKGQNIFIPANITSVVLGELTGPVLFPSKIAGTQQTAEGFGKRQMTCVICDLDGQLQQRQTNFTEFQTEALSQYAISILKMQNKRRQQ